MKRKSHRGDEKKRNKEHIISSRSAIRDDIIFGLVRRMCRNMIVACASTAVEYLGDFYLQFIRYGCTLTLSDYFRSI